MLTLPPVSLPILDLPGLVAQTGDDQELLRQLVEAFRRDAPEQVSWLLAAHGRGSLEEVRQRAHRLRGSLGYLHAPRAQRAASQLEQHPVSAELMAALEHELRELLRVLEDLVPQPSPGPHRDG